jgi:hypothetical protein
MLLLARQSGLRSVAHNAFRTYATKAASRPLIARYGPGSSLPVDLARVQSGLNVRLRDYETQKALNRFSYDLHIKEDGLVHPADGPNFIGAFPCTGCGTLRLTVLLAGSQVRTDARCVNHSLPHFKRLYVTSEARTLPYLFSKKVTRRALNFLIM